MAILSILTAAEQVANYLRSELVAGRWRETMPGAGQLATELGIGRNTIEAALVQLENQGLLINRGGRRSRLIAASNQLGPQALRIEILLYERSDMHDDFMVELRHEMNELGHSVVFSDKTLLDLDMDVKRVADYVKRTEAQAWVVRAGSRPVLEWFAQQSMPSFAIYGRHTQLPLAGIASEKAPALCEAVRKLFDWGHRRIVMLAREDRRKPIPGQLERKFLNELESLGIEVGPYHLPEWANNREAFYQRLEALFQHTPPTALIMGESALFFAAQPFFAKRGLAAPRDVSLLVLDQHPIYDWLQPEVSHIHTDTRSLVRRVVQWADHIAHGKKDRRGTMVKSQLVNGGTIGPVK